MMQITTIDASKQIADDYCTYALSTLNRALPDAIDGLKVSQRRIMQAGFNLGLHHDKPFRKVARWAGETSGTLHPHGSADDTIIHLANSADFMHPLVSGHGNLGGITPTGQRISDDGPAAGRYVEAKLSEFAEAVLDIPAKYLSTRPSYDGQLQEIVRYVPALPLALLNATSGIGTGYAVESTSFNLIQIGKAIAALPKGEREVIKCLGLPDYAQGCTLEESEGLLQVIAEGRGTFAMHGEFAFGSTELNQKRNKYRDTITITKLPVGSAEKFCTKIRDNVAESGLISNVEDFSSGEGIRVVVTLMHGVDKEKALQLLLQKTNLRATISVNNTMLAGALPEQMSPYRILCLWHSARLEVLGKMYADLLIQAKAEVHLLEGFCRVAKDARFVIDLILESEKAIADLIDFGFSEVQAKAILDLPIGKLNQTKLQQKLEIAEAEVIQLEQVLADLPGFLLKQVQTLTKKFGKPRQTKLGKNILMPAETAPRITKPKREPTMLETFYAKGAKLPIPMSKRKINSLIKRWKAGTYRQDCKSIRSMLESEMNKQCK